MAEVKLEPIAVSPVSVIGEGPHWDVETQSLYYNDIYGTEASLLRYVPKENRVYKATIEGEPVVSFVIPVKGTKNQFAVGLGRRLAVVEWDGTSPKANLVRVVVEVENEEKYKNNRWNDAKSDPTGRLFGGTMRLEECGSLFEAFNGSLYKYKAGEQLETLRTNVRVSNGLAFNEKTNKFYFVDSCDLDVKEFSWDPKTGKICKYFEL